MALQTDPAAADGDAQWAVYTLRATTSGATPVLLHLDGGSARLTLTPGRALAFEGLVVVLRADGDVTAGFLVKGVIVNDAGTTTLVPTPTVDVLGTNSLDVDVEVQANDTADALDLVVTGEDGETMRWVAAIRTVEVAF